MPVFDPSMTADKVASMLPGDALNASGHAPDVAPVFQTKGYIDARRKGNANKLNIPPELGINQQFKVNRVRIFNVGPFPHFVPLGSPGIFFIPACPENKPYVESLTPLHELEEEFYPSRDKREPMKRLQDEGRKIAIEILGEGRNQDKKQSRRRVGVFIAAGEEPTTKEIEAAKAELAKYAVQQVSIMDQAWDRDRKLAYDMFRPETFGACARVLGLTGKDKPWLAQGQPSGEIQCPNCLTSVNPDAPSCYNCGDVVNEEAYKRIKERRERLGVVAPEKRGPGRPRTVS
jgi:hypothetical protein